MPGMIGPPAEEAIPVLLEEFKAHHNSGAAYALGEIGESSPEIIGALQKALEVNTDSSFLDINFINETAHALRKLEVKPNKPDPLMLDRLSRQLKGEDMVVTPPEAMIIDRVQAAQALLLLGQHEEEAMTVLQKAIDQDYDSSVYYVIEMLGPLAQETAPKLIEKLKANPSNPLPVITALRSIATPEALHAVREYEELRPPLP